jgi:hypothetical protein
MVLQVFEGCLRVSDASDNRHGNLQSVGGKTITDRYSLLLRVTFGNHQRKQSLDGGLYLRPINVNRWREQICSGQQFGESDLVDLNLQEKLAGGAPRAMATNAIRRAAYRAWGHNSGLNMRFWHVAPAWLKFSGDRIGVQTP